MTETKNNSLEQKLKAIWKEKKYEIIDTIQKATPKKQGDKKNGIGVLELADVIGLTPQETQEFVKFAVQELNANIYLIDNRVYAHQAPMVTPGTHEDLFSLKKIDVLGQKEPVLGLRFGIISDTHFGSTRTNLGVLRAAYKYFEEQKITEVIHAGNILAGKVSREFFQDRITTTLEGQLELLAKGYPRHPTITTYFILGHKDCHFLDNKTDLISEIEDWAPNFKYSGTLRADLLFHTENKKPFKIRVSNEKQKYTYGISYQVQKRLDHVAAGEKPNVWLSGGNEQLWECRYRDVETLKLPGLQNQTAEMLEKGYQATVGFCIASVVPLEKSVEFYAKKFIDLGLGPSLQLKEVK